MSLNGAVGCVEITYVTLEDGKDCNEQMVDCR